MKFLFWQKVFMPKFSPPALSEVVGNHEHHMAITVFFIAIRFVFINIIFDTWDINNNQSFHANG